MILPHFESAWNGLIDRNDVLRTAFVWEGLEEPHQVVGRSAKLTIQHLDWRSIDDAERQDSLRRLLSQDREVGFGPSAAPLMRVTLIQEHSQVHRVVWSYHHLVLDGWSLPILLKQWASIYASGSRFGEAPRQSDSPRFRDYIAWLKNQDREAAIRYWKGYLRGLSAPTTIDFGRDTAPENHRIGLSSSDSVCRDLSDETVSKLKQLASRQRITASTIVGAAWATTISKYSGQSDVMFGMARSGRPPELPHFDERVGMFINTLPVRTQINDEQQVSSWLKELQRDGNDQRPFEHVSLTEIHSASDVPAGLPLFESILVFENYPFDDRRVGQGGEIELNDVDIVEQSNFPLSLYAVGGTGLSLRLLYDTSRFRPADAQQILSHVVDSLDQIAKCNDQPELAVGDILKLQLECTAGESLPLHEFDRVSDVIADHTRTRPDKVAVQFGDETVDYSELDRRVNELTEDLRSAGVVEGQSIGILIDRSISMVLALLAVHKVGCHYVPLDPSHPPDRLRDIINDSGLTKLIVSGRNNGVRSLLPVHKLVPDKRDLTPLKPLGEALSLLTFVDKAIGTKQAKIEADEGLAYLIYTSGTTGRPKGVPITHRNLTNLIRAMANRIGFDESRRLLAVTTLSFDIAALELLMPLYCGATVVIAGEETTRDAHRLNRQIKTDRIDTMQATPSAWRMCFEAGLTFEHDDESNEFVILCGGEATDIDLAKQLVRSGATVWNVYGPTETTIWSAALRLSEELIADQTVPIGNPIANTRLYVLGANQEPVPRGVAGELCIGGDGLSPGYHQRDELTRDRFVGIPDRVYRTGDRVRQREDGSFDFLGRFDEQIKLRGYRIELGEIESALLSHVAITQAVAVLEYSGTAQARLVAAYRKDHESNGLQADLTSIQLREHLSARLPQYMIPASFRELDSFPLSPNGKVDRKKTARMIQAAARRSSSEVASLPRTMLETKLATIWKELLQIDQIGMDDNFFELGGHSLLLLRAQDRLRSELDISVPLVDFFRHPTLFALASHIAEQDKGVRTETDDRTDAIAAGKNRLKQRLQRR
ncbi:MAG: amino acid adenylation domain-containing protein [Planctomycetota bacterium]